MKLNEKGSVTMIVVVTIFFIVILLSSFLIYASSRRKAQLKATEKIAQAYDGDMNQIYEEKTQEKEENHVNVPKGFYYVGGTKDTGIVISDDSADNGKYTKEKYPDQANIPADGLVGNQFVWVPVEEIDEFKRYQSYYKSSTQSISSFYEPSQEKFRYPNEEKEYNDMLKSVEINKGFYVARFEAGNENEKVVSKKGATVWNNISWGNSMKEIGTEGAVAKAQGMYTDKSTYAVTSTLIYGVQWDAIMAWIDPKYKKEDGTCKSFVSNSTGKGNYKDDDDSNNPATCGSSDAYRVNNIYDLAGNVREWTMEAYSSYSRVFRGGGYDDAESDDPASTRSSNVPNYSYKGYGFRPVLYL